MFQSEYFPTNVSGGLLAKNATEMNETPYREYDRLI